MTRRGTAACSRATSANIKRRASPRTYLLLELLGLLLRRLGDGPQARERAADQARDLHLGDAYPVGDLRLGHVLGEAQVEHDLIALGQGLQRGLDGRLVLDQVEALVLDADPVGEGVALGVSPG